MELMSFTGKGQEPFSNRQTAYKQGMAGWTYGVEVYTDNDDTGNVGSFGKRYYSWAMPVYTDDGGDYITFECTHLKDILGKFYIKDIATVMSDNTCKGTREVIPKWK